MTYRDDFIQDSPYSYSHCTYLIMSSEEYFQVNPQSEFPANFFDSNQRFNVDNTKTFGLRYRPYLEGKEDRDFAMQVIKHGEKTARTTIYAFTAPANGSNAGGLKETFYDLGKEKTCVGRMVEIWGQNICVPITKDNGRNDVKILWNKINDTQIQMF